MENDCSKISDLLAFYINDELNEDVRKTVENHLKECSFCRERAENISSSITPQFEALSAYIDNELDDKENLKLKKNIISNPAMRKELEKLYALKKVLKNSFKRKENEMKEDYTRLIFRELNLIEEVYGRNYFPQVAAIFSAIFLGLFFATFIIFGI